MKTSKSPATAFQALFKTAILMTAWGAAALCPAASRPTDPEWNQLTRDFVTPHVAWGVPLVGGPLRALSIDSRYYQRDLIELAQRLDLAYEFINPYLYGWGFPPSTTIFNYVGDEPDVKLAEFNRVITNDLDVILMGATTIFRVYPDEVIYRLFRKVHDGAGMVIINRYNHTGDSAPVTYSSELPEVDLLLRKTSVAASAPDHFLSVGVPFDRLRAWEGISSIESFEKKINLRTFGKGRIAILSELFPHYGSFPDGRFTPPLPKPSAVPPERPGAGEPEPVEFEYAYSLVAKVALWAGNRMPSVLLDRFVMRDAAGVATNRFDLDGLAGSTVALHVRPAEAAAGLVVDWAVRGGLGDGKVLHKDSTPLEQGAAVLALPPSLPIGPYFVDAWIRDGGNTVNWGSTAFDVTGNRGIARVAADRDSLAPGETLAVRIELAGGAPAGASLQVRAIGNYDRLLCDETVPLREGQTECEWTYAHRDRIGRWLTVVADWREGERLVDRGVVELPVRLPLGDADEWYPIGMGGADPTPIGRAEGLLLEKSDQRYVEMSCVGVNPYYLKSDLPLLRKARASARHNLGCYYRIAHFHAQTRLDNNVNTPCFNDPAIREQIRDRIQMAVRALKPFGGAYSLGDENEFSPGNSDACMCPHCNARFITWLQREYGTLEKLGASWGCVVTNWAEATPIDFPMARKNGQYPRWVDHKLHMAEDWGAFYGDQVRWANEIDPAGRAGIIYMQDVNGSLAVLRHVQMMLLAPTAKRNISAELMRSLDLPQALKGGFAAWAWSLERGAGQTYYFWDTFLNGARFGGWEVSRPGSLEGYITPDVRWYAFVKEFFHEFDQIGRGLDKLIFNAERVPAEVGIVFSEPSRHGPRILGQNYEHLDCYDAFRDLCWERSIENVLVPHDEMDAGGEGLARYKLIALPAVTLLSPAAAEHLRQYVAGGGMLVADVRPGIMDQHGKKLERGQLDDLFDTAVVADGNSTRDERKQTGKGAALLLNTASGSLRYNKERRPGFARAFDAALSAAGVTPALAASVKRFGHYRDGANEYALLLDRESKPCRFRFLRTGHLYDARQASYLGEADTAEIALTANRGRLISLLPYRVAGLALTGPARVKQGDSVRFSAILTTESKQQPGRHVFSVMLFGPDKLEARHYHQDVLAPGGRASIEIFFCLSEQVGPWRIVARDAATGMQAEMEFHVVGHSGETP
ncbi:MAG: beta-galactosidase trimerization domain-containing protein [Kiritimatiellae bacterium]|nr:beta-galactosidase trimerization domain-containing protein [Kiritimatiellia bacterium]